MNELNVKARKLKLNSTVIINDRDTRVYRRKKLVLILSAMENVVYGTAEDEHNETVLVS